MTESPPPETPAAIESTDPTESTEPTAKPRPAPFPSPAQLAAQMQSHPNTHASAGPAAAAPTPAAPASDPTQLGRVGEDGTVYVRTAQGERPVGSYPDAGPAEALAYFGRKFDELAGQVALLEQRLRAGGVSTKDAEAASAHLRESIVGAHAVGDLDSLLARLDVIAEQVEGRRKQSEAARAAAKAAAAEAKEVLVAEAETLAESADWKRTGDRLRALVEEWKKAPRLERKVDDALWKRFSHARTTFDKRRRAHFAELDEVRGEVAVVKEKLIKKAEELATSKEWGDTARAYRDLMTQWKDAGRARRDVEDSLWERFRAAQDQFFAARSEVLSARDAELVGNLGTKARLLAEAEALLPLTDHRAARTALRGIHERWEDAGHVPRADRDELEARLKKVDDTVRGAEETQWARSNPQARARAEDAVQQLHASIATLEAKAAKASAAGNEKQATEARDGAQARRSWLVEAEKTLAEFS